MLLYTHRVYKRFSISIKHMTYANQFISMPHADFFLQHTVMMNYAGKVYTVLKSIEIIYQQTLYWELYLVYAICMTLGMYWYTRFWLNPQDINEYYKPPKNTTHALAKISTLWITIGAACYYILFGVLFLLVCLNQQDAVACAFATWNAWCAANLLLATPFY